MSLGLVGLCLLVVIGLYYYNNPLKHGGWFLTRMGMQGTIVSGLLFCALAAATILAKVWLYGARQTPPEPETQAVLH